VDWSATGAMMGGIGAIAAAIETVVIILLTWRYVRITKRSSSLIAKLSRQ